MVPDKDFPAMASATTNMVSVEVPLYQRSYAGQPEYISPRCYWCYLKAEKRLNESRVHL